MSQYVVFVITFLTYGETVFSATVDQRQTGDLNVQVDLKNLQIVGLLKGKEEYVDYDYAYDYSEMTIKPPHSTTKQPLNVTDTLSSDNDTTTIESTVAEEPASTSSANNSTVTTEPVTIISPLSAANDTNATLNSTSSNLHDSIENTSTASSSCKRGFFRNSKGNCELKLQNPSNALIKIIKQKSKLNE